MDKKSLRKKIKTILLKMASEEKKHKDKQIHNQIRKMPKFLESKIIFAYVSMSMEVDTKKIIQFALKNRKKVFVPRVNLKKKKMDIIQINSLKELRKGTYNILEPCGRKCGRNKFDIILIPGLGFDKKNNRLGRGGGYFDKFLRNAKGLKIGLCYKEQLFKHVPITQHDIKMDVIISD